jgi:hypothetical protein
MEVALLLALVGLLLVRGIVPAMSGIDADFPSYFTAAKIVADGSDVDRLYDIAWFQAKMRAYHVGVPEEGKFSPLPPTTALLLVPLVHLNPQNALRVLTLVSALSLALSAMLVAKILGVSPVESAIFVLLSGYGIFNGLRFGQPYMWVSTASLLGYFAYLRKRPVLAGACFGLFVPLKYFPVVFLTYFAARREWKVVLGGAFAILAVLASSVGILGLRIHAIFLTQVLGNHLIENLAMQDPFSVSFQSFDSLFHRLFVFDAALNKEPALDATGLEPELLALTKAAILFAAIVALVKLNRRDAAAARAPSMALLGIVGLLLAPATASYHFVLLWLPLTLLLGHLSQGQGPRRPLLILTLYALIGFFPYKLTQPFDGQGVLTLLAYPRLGLLLAMFTASLYFILNPARAIR